MKALATVALSCVVMAACIGDDDRDELGTGEQADQVVSAPAGATPVPADYNGDGATDMAFKANNGQWYLDYGVCGARAPLAETGASCNNNLDDDGDGLINDGCPASGAAETNCDNMQDDDGDTLVNDGCSRCQGQDRYGGRWDFAYTRYGFSNAVPVPADYGKVGGGVDGEKRADLAIKDDTGLWAIDYADNGFGAWDRMVYGYGNAAAVPVPADYDGDLRADLAIKTSAGQWLIDYASNGFNGWDPPNAGCTPGNCAQLPLNFGNDSWIAIPGDYNGDLRADLAVTGFITVNGLVTRAFRIDFSNSSNTGFSGQWQVDISGYGNTATTAVPFNYDPWRDNKTDLAVKDGNGAWYIDYAFNGFGSWDAPCPMAPPSPCGTSPRTGYGGSWSQAVPGDYDGDTIVDLSVKDTNGHWYMDLGYNGWNGWDYIPGTQQISIDNPARLINDTTRPYITSTRIFGEGNIEASALTVGVRYTIDVVMHRGSSNAPGMNTAGVEINPVLDVPSSLAIVGRTGTTYDPDVRFDDGSAVTEVHRRFAITCREPGNFPLGFQVRDLAPYFYASRIINPDYGMRVVCVAPAQTGLSGRATKLKRENDELRHGRFIPGDAVPTPSVEVYSSIGTLVGVTSGDFQGNWRVPVQGGPYKVRITAANRSEVIAVNVMVPASGLRLDTPMAQDFTMLPAGTRYRTYIDYSRGRTVLHAVTINRASTSVRVGKADYGALAPQPETACTEPAASGVDNDGDGYINDGCPIRAGAAEVGYQCANGGDDDNDGFINDGCTTCIGPLFDKLWEMGDLIGSRVIMNGTWWNTCNSNAVGYVYAGQYLASDVHCDNRGNPTPGCQGANVYYAEDGTPLYTGYRDTELGPDPATAPMFTIAGTGTNQTFGIVATKANFMETAYPEWKHVPHPIWDVAAPFKVSDVDYAIQIPNPPLVRDGLVIGSGDFRHDTAQNYDYAFARTAIGLGPTGVYWVVADGENVHGGNGATANQLGHFFRDVLGATHAMGLDSGLSTEMLIRTPQGLFRVNTITGEDAGIQINPYTELLDELPGNVGSVGYYLSAGP